MSNRSRLGLVVAAALVAVAAFLALKPDEGSEEADNPSTTVPQDGSQNSPTTPRPVEPAAIRIEVRDGAPVGGVRRISVDRGERIRFLVRSADSSDEVHLHGYDVAKRVSPGRPVRFDVPATIEGTFEIELEEAGRQIARLTVEP